MSSIDSSSTRSVGPLPRQVEVVDDDPVVQTGATDQQRLSAGPADLVERRGVRGLELGDREVVVGVDQVEAVVRDLGRSCASAWRCRCPSAGTPACCRPTRGACRALDGRPPSRRPTCRRRSSRRWRRGVTGGDAARRSERFALCDALVVVDHLGDDEPEELLGEHRVESGLLGQRPQAGDLDLLAAGSAGGRSADALYRPTALVILNRSASRCTSAASMLSMLAR